MNQVAQLFEETHDSESSGPNTPMFRRKAGSIEQDNYKRQFEEMQAQNVVLRKQVEQLQSELSKHSSLNFSLQQSLRRVMTQMHEQMMKNQQLTDEYMVKHEECFQLRKQQYNSNQNDYIMQSNTRVATCPSECSTLSSPSMHRWRAAKNHGLSIDQQ